jgi:hypothetical protein
MSKTEKSSTAVDFSNLKFIIPKQNKYIICRMSPETIPYLYCIFQCGFDICHIE